MSELTNHYDEEGNLLGFVTEDGEFIDLSEMPRGGDVAGYIARKRLHANAQVKRWEQIRAGYDAVLMAKQEVPKASYDGVSITIRTDSYPVVNGAVFANLVYEQYSRAFTAACADILTILAAAKTYDASALPEDAVPLLQQSTERRWKRPFVMSNVIAEDAPARRTVA